MHYLALLLFLFTACNAPGPKNPSPAETATPNTGGNAAQSNYTGKLPISKIKLPAGFRIGVFAEGLNDARSLCYSPSGTLFVGTRENGSVYALRDTDGDFVADQRHTIATKLNSPNGVAFRNGSLYVAEINRILRFDDIENKLDKSPSPVVVYDKYPTDDHHGWKYIAFGPDGKLYVPVGAPCNVCDKEKDNPEYASITRLDVDKPGKPEVLAHGVRNTVGFDWHPVTNELWFTENGRDWMGDNSPDCELNRATQAGMHFGFPYCHAGNLPDDKFGKDRACGEFTPPVEKLGPHVAPLGMEFYTGAMFPAAYKNQIFLAEHGSWNRSNKIGYQLSVVKLDANGKSLGKEAFATGWLEGEEVWGRPVDVELLPDGSMLVSDDHADAVYRIYYAGQ